MQNICCHLVTAMNGLLKKKPFDGEHKGLLDETVSMLEELMQLYAALDTRSVQNLRSYATLDALNFS